jgi:hypothetical protein
MSAKIEWIRLLLVTAAWLPVIAVAQGRVIDSPHTL